MKNVMLFLFILMLFSTQLVSMTANTGGCDYQNQDWLNEILADSELCNSCIGEINVYRLNDTIYIGILESRDVCSDNLTTIYYCDGTEFCLQGGFAGFQECNDWLAQEPVLIETLWSRASDCGCICIEIYDPVCGTNGITYTNACFAECDGQFDYVAGECNPNSFTCDWEELSWLDSLLEVSGLCESCIEAINVYELHDTTFIAFLANNTTCADALTTVFTCDFEVYCLDGGFAGFTECEDFFNSPDLVLVETIWKYEDQCGCVCPTIYQPVCGSDGITYSNSCFAACEGITEFTDGECTNSVEDLNFQDWQISQIAPNPTSDVVHISFASVEKSLQLDVYNTLGVLLKTIDLGRSNVLGEVTLEMQEWASGVYFLVFSTDTERRGVRLVKN